MAHSSHLAITRIPNSANRHPFRILECIALSNVYVHSKEKETANKVARSVKYVFLGNANSYRSIEIFCYKIRWRETEKRFRESLQKRSGNVSFALSYAFLWLNHAFSLQSSHIKKVLDAARTIFAIM